MADKSEPKPTTFHLVYTVTNIQQRLRTLDGQKLSYHSWVKLFKLHAIGFDVLQHIDGSPAPEVASTEYPAWKKIDAIVLQWIYGTISDKLFDQVLVDESTSYEAWKRGENMFMNNKGSRAATLQYELTNLTLAAMPSLEA
ncbi:uncharacterized protein LOC143616841 [Bidens hawaiensis]|uniref:uncharacterized protein LOC143616841 n=1 Tax=Bidens hawaiensis TaxID=980011 RepID=UPI00404915F5